MLLSTSLLKNTLSTFHQKNTVTLLQPKPKYSRANPRDMGAFPLWGRLSPYWPGGNRGHSWGFQVRWEIERVHRKKKDLSGLQVEWGTIMRVACEVGISVRTKDTRGGSV